MTEPILIWSIDAIGGTIGAMHDGAHQLGSVPR
jgi:hypothetical protein